MNNKQSWILIDTVVTSFTTPVFALDLAAQKMLDWNKDGEPFQCLINNSSSISTDTSNKHTYAREIIERDGSVPTEAYRNFEAYCGALPVVAFNLKHNWNDILIPEWKRLGIAQIGVPGFCAMKLTQRLLDPMPAGICNLQTLRQYYRLSNNGMPAALGDVQTIIDLMQQVLRPLAEKRGLDTWEKIVAFSGDEWFPSRLSFGKFKGRLYQEALDDAELKAWL